MRVPPFPDALKTYRELSGDSQSQLASRVGVSEASVSRWTRGHSLPLRETAEHLDSYLNARGALLASWRSSASGSALPEWARSMDAVEREAVSLEFVSPSVVPGYLQCESYARHVFSSGQPLMTREEIDRLVAVRCQRLSTLGLHVTAVFPVSGVSALDPPVIREQASALLSWVATGMVSVLLVPEGSMLAGVTSPLLLFRLRDGTTAASSEHLTGNVMHEDSAHPRLAALVKGAMASALPVRESKAILEGLAQ